jgi:hypothetical protein
MTVASLSGLAVQVVQQSTSTSGSDAGNKGFLTGLAVQLVTESKPESVLVSSLALQVVSTSIPERVLLSSIIGQVLIQSGTSGQVAWAGVSPQVVYTIGIDDTPRQRAWTFDLDGHTFYVLDMGDQGALAYDLKTQSWSRWSTQGYEGHFNMKNGFHWRGGKQVVGGSLLDGGIVALDEEATLDEGFRPILYEVQGVLFATSEDAIRQYNLRMIGSPGRRGLDDDVTPPVLNMTFSDDNGATWSTPRAVTLTSDKEQRIEFRSLGRFRQPGRIFRLYDSGGIKFIAYVMADVEGE